MTTHRLALIGAGSMGNNHARVIAESPRASLDVVIDPDQERARRLASRYGASAESDIERVEGCDAAILAASTEAHVPVGLALLDQGIPILVEKPIAVDVSEVERLCEAAVKREVVLACGFVERFNAVVNQGMNLLDEAPMHIVTMRHSPIFPRIADSVIYDLLIHDIDLAMRFMKGAPVHHATGASWCPPGSDCAEIADCTLQFTNGGLATLSASRVGQRKLRSVQVFTNAMMLDLDLLRADLTVYRNVRQEQPDNALSLTYRAETIIDIPFVRHSAEPLALELDHFLDLVEGKADWLAEVEGLIGPHRVAHSVETQCSAESGWTAPVGSVTG
jgi:predicted dehydrogenase